MAYVKRNWHAEPWIKTVTRDEFIAWALKNGKGTAEEMAEVYDTVNPPKTEKPVKQATEAPNK